VILKVFRRSSGKGKKSTLPPEKRAALVLRLSNEEPAAQIARRAGVSEQTLYRWREDFLNAGKQALAGLDAEREQVRVSWLRNQVDTSDLIL
jgi:transposase-like protein